MSQQTIAIGSSANDGTGDPLRTAFNKANNNFTELYRLGHPGYVASNWYLPAGLEGTVNAGSSPGSGSIRLIPGFIKQKITLNALGMRITTLSASGNVQAAIYANNYTTNRPTGSALASTASITTGSTGNVNSAVSVQLDVGMYWFASNCDNAVAVFSGPTPASCSVGALIGSATQANDLSSTQSLVGVSVAQTFGAWPDLTSGAFADITTASGPFVQFKVASVP